MRLNSPLDSLQQFESRDPRPSKSEIRRTAGSSDTENSLLETVEDGVACPNETFLSARAVWSRLTSCEDVDIVPRSQREKNVSSFHVERPSLTRLHLELQELFLARLRADVENKDLFLKQNSTLLHQTSKMLQKTMGDNTKLNKMLSSIQGENLKLKEEVKQMSILRQHLDLAQQRLDLAEKEVKQMSKLRQRLDLAEKDNNMLLQRLDLADKNNNMLRDAVQSRDALLQKKEDEINEVQKDLEITRLDLKEVEKNEENLVREVRLLEHYADEVKTAKALIRAQQEELKTVKNLHKQEMQETEKRHEESMLKVQVELRVLAKKNGLVQPHASDGLNDIVNDELRAIIEVKDESIVALRNQVMASESTRRQLHNVIQNLRGNIRVFVRVRPMLEKECKMNKGQENDSPLTVVEAGNAISIRGPTEQSSFEFDKVYGPASTQAIIFDELSDFVQSALDGHSVCIFAYGQT